MNKGALITIAFLILVASVSIDLLWTGNKYQCEICIKYKDQIVCQKVKGMEKQDTIMTGISTACGGRGKRYDRIHRMPGTTPRKNGMSGYLVKLMRRG